MKRLIVIFLFLCITAFSSRAQNYKWSEGLAFQPSFYNGAVGIGVNVKQFLKNGQNLDYGLYYYFKCKGSEFNIAYEWNTRVFTDDLFLYGGPAFGFGVVSTNSDDNILKHATFSAIGVCGLEYMFHFAPLSLSFDWRPHLRYRTRYQTLFFSAVCFNLAVKIYF